MHAQLHKIILQTWFIIHICRNQAPCILFALYSRESDESSETDDGHQYCDSWSPPPGPIRSNPEPEVCVRVCVCVCVCVCAHT